jgi:hypothetical protein
MSKNLLDFAAIVRGILLFGSPNLLSIKICLIPFLTPCEQ